MTTPFTSVCSYCQAAIDALPRNDWRAAQSAVMAARDFAGRNQALLRKVEATRVKVFKARGFTLSEIVAMQWDAVSTADIREAFCA